MESSLELATLDEIWDNIGDYECNFYPDDPTDSFEMPQFPNLKKEQIDKFEPCHNKTSVPSKVGQPQVKREEPETLHSLNKPSDQQENIIHSPIANISCKDAESLKTFGVKEELGIDIDKESLREESRNYGSAAESYVKMTTSLGAMHEPFKIKRENSTVDFATTTTLANSLPTYVNDDAVVHAEFHEDARRILQPDDNISAVAALDYTTECNVVQPGEVYLRLKTETPNCIPEAAPQEMQEENMKVADLQRNGRSHANSHDLKHHEDGRDQLEDKTEVWQVLHMNTDFDDHEAANSSLRPSRQGKRKRACVISSDTDSSDDELDTDDEGNSGIQSEPPRWWPGEPENSKRSRLRRFLLRQQGAGDFADFPAEKLLEMVDCSARSVFKCKTCFKEWSCTNIISTHVYAHARGKYFSCLKCGRDFKAKNLYDVHQELHRLKIWREKDGLGFGMQHTCQICNTTFPTKHSLKKHGLSHRKEEQPYRCGCCDKVFKESRPRTKHEMTHCVSDARKQSCKLCDKTFCNEDTLRRHVKLHDVYNADTGSYECPECPQKFSCAKNFLLHAITHNTNSVICDRCGRQFREDFHFTWHRRHCQVPKKKKNPEEKFPCDVCGKEFGKKQVLQRHKLVHSGSRPFACKHCEMRFQQSGTRDRHEALHFKSGQFRDVTKHVMNVKEGKDGRKYISTADSN